MGLDVPVFKFIDYLYNIPQNRPALVRKYNKNLIKVKDIVYDESNPKDCKLDTYRVDNGGKKYPVVFIIHGGGFVAGDKKYRRCLSAWFAQETGAYVFNVNYGLGPKTLFPLPVKQLVTAANWIYDHKDELNIDVDKMLITGDSAGAYYAAELCTLQSSKLQQERLGCSLKCKFNAALLNCGIYDVDRALSAKTLFDLAASVCKDFTGVAIEDIKKYKYLDVLSPLNHITPDFPKSCVVYAEQDFFCGGQGELLVEKLNENGVYNEVYYSTAFADNHTFQSTWYSKAAREANDLFLSFAKRFFEGTI